jgi:hypothetical protein
MVRVILSPSLIFCSICSGLSSNNAVLIASSIATLAARREKVLSLLTISGANSELKIFAFLIDSE